MYVDAIRCYRMLARCFCKEGATFYEHRLIIEVHVPTDIRKRDSFLSFRPAFVRIARMFMYGHNGAAAAP